MCAVINLKKALDAQKRHQRSAITIERVYAEGCTDSPATTPAGLQKTQAQLQTSHRLAPTNSTRISDS